MATVRSASGRSTQEPPLPLPWHCDRGARAPSAGQSDSRDERPGAIAPRRRLRSSLGRNDYRRDHVSGEPGGVLGAACSDRDESIVSKRSAAPVRGKAHLANIHPRAPAAGPQHKRGRAAVVVASVPEQACDRWGIAPFTQASGRGFETRFSPIAGLAQRRAQWPICIGSGGVVRLRLAGC